MTNSISFLQSLGVASCAAFSFIVPAAARTIQVGPGLTYPTPSAAAGAVHDGDTVTIARGKYTDCAVWYANNLTIAGAGAGDTTIGGVSCQGKGVFVIYGSNVAVRDLTLAHAKVPDQNGAGIRFDGGNLSVQRVTFDTDQDGILAATVPGTTIWVRDSLFRNDGFCGALCAHGIYVGGIGLLRVEHTVFQHTMAGHSIKSRAAQTDVANCTITDGPTGTSSYLVDAPNGGVVSVTDSRLEKGPLSGNPGTALSIGEEGVTWPTNAISVARNVFRDDNPAHTTFVVNRTSAQAVLQGNALEGAAITPLVGPGTVTP